MKSAALGRLESLLQSKKLDGTLLQPWSSGLGDAAQPTGIVALDAVLAGGWRRGEVSEIIGARSTGRMSLLTATLAAATKRGEVVGLVDALDRFDPISAASAGLDLDRLLWVRGPAMTIELCTPDRRGHTSIHRIVQQAVRAFDLIVRAGGFAVAALDLADVPARAVRALPWTTWMRVAHANEGRKTACLLVGEAAMGKSARGVTVRLEASRRWKGTSAQSRRFAGLAVSVTTGAGRVHDLGTPDTWGHARGAVVDD